MQMQLTPRKREILRRVIEEYVATGQPVGSRVLVERTGLRYSSSTVRSELAELESLGLLTHPHTSAGRTPTESGYRVYAEELVDTVEGRPEALGVDLRTMRDEIEQALRMTTEMLSEATRLLALVSAPSLETASIRHIEVLTLQPTSVMVVVITSTGGVTKQVFRLEEPVDPGLVAWAGEYLEEQLVGERIGSRTVRRRLQAPELAPRERAFLALIGQTMLEVGAEVGPQVFVGGTAGLVGGARVEEVEATMRLVELLERRAAVLELVSEALEPQRPVVHVGPEVGGAELHSVSVVGATYGIRSTPLGAVGLVGPLRMDYEKAIRTVRAAAFELSRFVEDFSHDA
jgi:heat-inducible transcriptional repressor